MLNPNASAEEIEIRRIALSSNAIVEQLKKLTLLNNYYIQYRQYNYKTLMYAITVHESGRGMYTDRLSNHEIIVFRVSIAVEEDNELKLINDLYRTIMKESRTFTQLEMRALNSLWKELHSKK